MLRVETEYKTVFLGKTREFRDLASLILYANGVKDASTLPTLELLLEFRVYRHVPLTRKWVEIDLLKKAILRK